MEAPEIAVHASQNPVINEMLVTIGGVVFAVGVSIISYLVVRLISSNDKAHERTASKVDKLKDYVVAEVKILTDRISLVDKRLAQPHKTPGTEYLSKSLEHLREEIISKFEEARERDAGLQLDIHALKSDTEHRHKKTEITMVSTEKVVRSFLEQVPVIQETKAKVAQHDDALDKITTVVKAQSGAIRELRKKKE